MAKAEWEETEVEEHGVEEEEVAVWRRRAGAG